MRLLFAMSSLASGGAERHTVTLANRLAERGHEAHVVCLKRDPNPSDRLRLRGGTERCLEVTRYLDWRALTALAAHIAQLQPAVIVAANPYALMYCWLALRLSRMRSALVVTYHATLLLGLKEWLQMLVYRPFFWSADSVVFVCEGQCRHWLRRGVFARRNEVIYNGVDTEEFRDRWSPAERERLRAAYGFAPDDFVIGISAWLRPEKNHLQLVEAVAELRARKIPARSLMIGEGEMRAAIEARARALGVAGDIVITGYRKDVRPCVAACDAMVLCSITEAFSLAAIEAMALRKPVVHSCVGGAPEMIRPGREGFLFAVGDTPQLVQRLAQLADPALARRLGAQARRTVEERFAERAMIDRYEHLLLLLETTQCRTRSERAANC